MAQLHHKIKFNPNRCVKRYDGNNWLHVLMLTHILTMARVVGEVKVSETVWGLPGEKGASHMCKSSRVWFTPSRRFWTTRGSLEYSGRTLMSAGSAEIWARGNITVLRAKTLCVLRFLPAENGCLIAKTHLLDVCHLS